MESIPTSPAGVPGRAATTLTVTELDLIGDAVLVTDPEGVIVDVNDAFVRLTGYSREEAIGQSPRLLSSGLHGSEVYDELWRTITAGEVWQGELVDRRRDGRLRTYQIMITPVQDGHGQITHFVGVQRDVAEVADHPVGGSSGVAHTDAGATCLYADAQVARLLGRAPADLLGGGLEASLRADDAWELREVVARTVETGRRHHLELQVEEGRWLGVEAGPLAVGSGATIGARLAFEDITDRVELRAELARQEAMVAGVLDAFEDAIAVIGPDGLVVATNTAWRGQQDDVPASPWAGIGDGDEVLTHLRRQAARGNEDASRIALALERVLSGRSVNRAVPGGRVSQLAWDEGGAIVRLG